MTLRLKTPLGEADARKLRAGDSVLLTGVIYTARDAAHKRLCELVEAGKPLPFDPMDAVVYYVGPTPAAPGQIIGSAGPTTSYRMDAYAPTLIALGLRGMIGKGRRNAAVIASMKQHGAVYFGAIGGCSSSRAFSRPLEMHSNSVNSAAVPLRRNTLWERQFSPRKLPGVRYAISSGAERLFASRLATSRSLPLRTRQTSSL